MTCDPVPTPSSLAGRTILPAFDLHAIGYVTAIVDCEAIVDCIGWCPVVAIAVATDEQTQPLYLTTEWGWHPIGGHGDLWVGDVVSGRDRASETYEAERERAARPC